jgi:hypothetical protein
MMTPPFIVPRCDVMSCCTKAERSWCLLWLVGLVVHRECDDWVETAGKGTPAQAIGQRRHLQRRRHLLTVGLA